MGGYDAIRGFIQNRAQGMYNLYGNFEFRPTLGMVHAKKILGTVVFQGNVFVDAGRIQPYEGSPLALLSTGLGLRVHFTRFSGAILRFDVARSLFPWETWDWNFSIGQFF
jgi:hemolysin activation/secretion protein